MKRLLKAIGLFMVVILVIGAFGTLFDTDTDKQPSGPGTTEPEPSIPGTDEPSSPEEPTEPEQPDVPSVPDEPTEPEESENNDLNDSRPVRLPSI